MSKLRIGIVGCGAIGGSLARSIARDFSKRAKLVAFYDIDIQRSRRLSEIFSKNKSLAVFGLKELIKRSDLVIEAASSDASWEIAKEVLAGAKALMIMSVGGVAAHVKEISMLAQKHKVGVYIPSGALCGIDAVKAASIAKVKRVILTTYKNPVSFRGVEYVQKQKINLNKLKEDKVLFFGSAKQAVKYFPQNINVAAVLSMAGIGIDKTRVKIIASPFVKRNIHEIQLDSEAGRIFSRTENILHPDNPKTSFLAVLSAIAVLRQILEPVKIGT
ncbi:MAG: aspartate dehydrogenase [Candidatus Omnitrophota bacterium]|nr:aspartate dehydrogenase [Candidatus Omnitrophota bacterium]